MSDGARGGLRRDVQLSQDRRGSPADSAFVCRDWADPRLEGRRRARGTGGVGVFDVVGQGHLAEQRLLTLARADVSVVEPEASQLADAATDLLVLGAREGRAGQGHRAVDGTREGRHDAQHLRTSHRWRTSSGRRRSRIGIVHYCSQTGRGDRANSLRNWLAALDDFPQPWLIRESATG